MDEKKCFHRFLRRLFDVLKEVGWQDWQVAGLVCKTLWNYTEHMTSSEAELGVKLSDSFIDLLNGYCGEKKFAVVFKFKFNQVTFLFRNYCVKTTFPPIDSFNLLKRRV